MFANFLVLVATFWGLVDVFLKCAFKLGKYLGGMKAALRSSLTMHLRLRRISFHLKSISVASPSCEPICISSARALITAICIIIKSVFSTPIITLRICWFSFTWLFSLSMRFHGSWLTLFRFRFVSLKLLVLQFSDNGPVPKSLLAFWFPLSWSMGLRFDGGGSVNARVAPLGIIMRSWQLNDIGPAQRPLPMALLEWLAPNMASVIILVKSQPPSD